MGLIGIWLHVVNNASRAKLRAGWFVAMAALLPAAATAEIVEVDLTIAQAAVEIEGALLPAAMTVNGGIPGPVLRFREGDTARIHVHNEMDVDTSVHWHGLLVPPGMDGVPYISFPPIAPHSTFTYEFPIRQSGTYWYHSHTHLQEQRGVYGAIVISPREGAVSEDRDHVVVLSDWTSQDPGSVIRTLRSGNHYYSIAKGSGQSIVGAAKLGMLGDFVSRELQRMPPMDISDIAYDWFLANGRPQTSLSAETGETVRVRIVDGSATTYFYLEFAGGPMTIVSADGQPVEPVEQQRILIGVAETYDVVIEIPGPGAWELRATAHDGSSWASIWLGEGERHPAPTVPRPNLYATMGGLKLGRVFALTPGGSMGMSNRRVDAGELDKPGMPAMDMDMDMQSHDSMSGMHADDGGMEMAGMHGPSTSPAPRTGSDEPPSRTPAAGDEKAPEAPPNGKRFASRFGLLATDVAASPSLAIDGEDPERPMPPYPVLRATHSTAPDPDRPVREVRLTLDGDMGRYVWFLNNLPLSPDDTIRIREGETVRFIMINRSMMHHPMHLHGHFFRVVNGQGDRAPLKHTVDVAPMTTTVIEFPADEVGDWFFHCHLLYHMMSGMARVVHYEEFTPPPAVSAVRPRLYHDQWYPYAVAEVTSNMSEGMLILANMRNTLALDWEAGWKNVDGIHWEGIASYDRYFNRFFSVFVGAHSEGIDTETEFTRGVLGLRYLLPLNLESMVWVDSDGGWRVAVEKELEITPRIGLHGEARYDSHEKWEESVALSYTLTSAVAVAVRWHSEYGTGVGVRLRF
ncbi:MAG: multicopper oxidase domain-containing protein [Thermoanaerobaculales bacterium]|nr:multicopper oxidase domain-containing protein [Thermoanaerobaculales bacterium]